MSPREAKVVKLFLVFVALLLVTGVVLQTLIDQREYGQQTCALYPEDC